MKWPRQDIYIHYKTNPLDSRSGQSEAPNSLGVMELMKLMHTCVNSENSAIKKTLQLKAELHFEIGKSLKVSFIPSHNCSPLKHSANSPTSSA